MSDLNGYTDSELLQMGRDISLEQGRRQTLANCQNQVLSLVDEYHLAGGDLASLCQAVDTHIQGLLDSD
jgi:hypothetical protein